MKLTPYRTQTGSSYLRSTVEGDSTVEGCTASRNKTGGIIPISSVGGVAQ